MFYHPNMISGLHVDSQIAAEAHLGQSFVPLEAGKATSSETHKTLIPVDGSEGASRAIEYAGRLARRGWTSEIHLLNVQPLVMQEEFALSKPVQLEQRARVAAARQILNGAQERLPVIGVACKSTIGFGTTARMIARYAHENGINAIVMGTRGNRGFRRLLGGSVAAAVARLAEVPVTVLRLVGKSAGHVQQSVAGGLQTAAT
jgi:nucleotide-binding universal stress UspA family protein